MKKPLLFTACLLVLSTAACQRPSQPSPVPSSAVRSLVPSASAPVAEPSCSAVHCQRFATAQEAFQAVLAESPRILSIGEYHAQRGYEQLPSAVERFSRTMLPMLQGKASDLVVEVWIPPGKCTSEQKKVEKEQREVKQQQSSRNPNDYVALATEAKKFGIEPFPLRPSCEDFREINAAGEGSILTMLKLTARLLESGASRAYERNQKKGDPRLVLTFGGAMHNDLRPDHSCGKPCSFGEAFGSLTQEHYVELDMVVPEYVEDREFWRARSWYPHFSKSMVNGNALLMNPAPHSYVLFFPSTPDFKPESSK